MTGAAPASAGQQTAIHFAIYDANEGGKLLWKETQIVAVDASGQYTAFLGAMSADGLPLDVFAGGAPRWLAVEGPNGPLGARTLLAAVPYAVSAATASNASTLAGRPATDFLLTPAARRKDAAVASTTGAASDALDTPLVNNGTANFIGKFFNNVDLINSSLYDAGGLVGLNTTTPLDIFHSRFTNAGGTQTGLAVQNLSSGANAYSGMLFYDHTGALRQFQGYNNSSGEYRINNISPSGSINFMIGSTPAFTVNTNRSIAISGSTTTRSVVTSRVGTNYLEVQGNGFSGVVLTNSTGGNDWFLYRDSSHNLNFYYNLTDLMTIQPDGKVGIGTSTPTRAKLDIVGGAGTYDYGTRGVLNSSGATQLVNTGTSTNNSIFADGFIWSAATLAVSDARIKRIQGRSNGATDLATLMSVKITDYSFIDTIAKGQGVQKKVIAQELEEVYPQAVRRTRDVVPDIYSLATMTDGWIMLSTDLKKGDRVRLYVGDSAKLHEVLEVGTGRFRTALAEADGTKVFVYGREVDDFRAVDYEGVSMLNVSATQELARRLEQQTAETAALKQELADMRTALTAALEAVAAAAKAQQQR